MQRIVAADRSRAQLSAAKGQTLGSALVFVNAAGELYFVHWVLKVKYNKEGEATVSLPLLREQLRHS